MTQMHLETIVVPTDFSPASEAAVRYATNLAAAVGGSLVIMHAEYPLVTSTLGGATVVADSRTPTAADRLKKITPHQNVPYKYRLVSGKPSDAIIRLATDLDAELIVIGAHGKTGFERLFLGSTAEEVVRGAACPVTVLKATA